MSLINDALKRAKESQPGTTPAPEPVQPMKPVDPPPAPPRSHRMPPYFLPSVLVVLSGACWFLVKGWETKRQAGLYPAPITVSAREIVPALSSVSTPAESTPATQSSNSVGSLKPATASAANDSALPALAPSPRPPSAFKLQGIFYRPSNPSAVINAKTVFIGDTIDEARIKTIDRQSVTLVHDGQTEVLTLR